MKIAVMLAPMAGITDLPFRNLVAGFGAGMVVSEMVASWLSNIENNLPKTPDF